MTLEDARTLVQALPKSRLDAAKVEFSKIETRISDRALMRRPKPLNFEVYHEVVTARDAFIMALAKGDSPIEAARAAAERIKL